ncbi:UNVERIFIED_CONTAM: hypothetical protein GTU68_064102 [Idotea baltica]|nr:hypothetical protein [Idotea baltica]
MMTMATILDMKRLGMDLTRRGLILSSCLMEERRPSLIT